MTDPHDNPEVQEPDDLTPFEGDGGAEPPADTPGSRRGSASVAKGRPTAAAKMASLRAAKALVKGEGTKATSINVRVSEGERAFFERTAAISGQTPSDLLRNSAVLFHYFARLDTVMGTVKGLADRVEALAAKVDALPAGGAGAAPARDSHEVINAIASMRLAVIARIDESQKAARASQQSAASQMAELVARHDLMAGRIDDLTSQLGALQEAVGAVDAKAADAAEMAKLSFESERAIIETLERLMESLPEDLVLRLAEAHRHEGNPANQGLTKGMAHAMSLASEQMAQAFERRAAATRPSPPPRPTRMG